MKKNLHYYLSLPYSIVTKEINDETGHYYVGRVEELYDVKTVGNTIEELYKNIYEVLEMSIEDRLEDGEDIPEPIEEKYSGRILARIPKSLHKFLSEQAEIENTSLNQLILYKLSK
ncbi:toxin-antitoxin system HicB family antitoxin [Anaerococcus rubeinfantis]|uniref:toxin-antitoxin system HicB family antitoxin n=1 Tax=Anaerococcus rubeinfantis TaxID=1720199 RepID=UPI00073F9744|nr:toxin-antitoxin system HicB family antitoxin [Anaerococcus rubeinfantis]